MVRDELLRDLFPTVEDRSCECLRANGTGGGAFLCTGAASECFANSLVLTSDIDGKSCVLS